MYNGLHVQHKDIQLSVSNHENGDMEVYVHTFHGTTLTQTDRFRPSAVTSKSTVQAVAYTMLGAVWNNAQPTEKFGGKVIKRFREGLKHMELPHPSPATDKVTPTYANYVLRKGGVSVHVDVHNHLNGTSSSIQIYVFKHKDCDCGVESQTVRRGFEHPTPILRWAEIAVQVAEWDEWNSLATCNIDAMFERAERCIWEQIGS